MKRAPTIILVSLKKKKEQMCGIKRKRAPIRKNKRKRKSKKEKEGKKTNLKRGFKKKE